MLKQREPGYMDGRTNIPVTVVLTPEIDERLSAYAKNRGENRSVIVREALRRLFAEEGFIKEADSE